jgi:lambda repressor-like predicted transcriptional regulator
MESIKEKMSSNNHRKHVLAAVKQDGLSLEYASAELKNDREIVLAAVNQKGSSLDYASGELRHDREIVLAAVKQDWRYMWHASGVFKNDREIVLAAVSQNGIVLACAKMLNNDREIVMTAVNQDGRAVHYVSDEMKRDLDIILTAVTQQPWSIIHVTKQIEEAIILDKKRTPEEIYISTSKLIEIFVIVNTHLPSVLMMFGSNFKRLVTEHLVALKCESDKFFNVFLYGWIVKGVNSAGKTPPNLGKYAYCMQLKHKTTDVIKNVYFHDRSCGERAESVSTNKSEVCTSCKLLMLNKLGKYVTIQVKKIIADYADIYYGKRLRTAESALLNLHHP